ncbi:hypothetical protein PsYK624_118670 [Phanerochaete sordida]|uniref:Uncharacterized protein n=1 Tax=Phanerochaete sordida TaxID=48140 RepID=A0A9P3LHM1_9APHY|nr:hypothetical protein PsYK624_118670 [Phanerochaete sordida]
MSTTLIECSESAHERRSDDDKQDESAGGMPLALHAIVRAFLALVVYQTFASAEHTQMLSPSARSLRLNLCTRL